MDFSYENNKGLHAFFLALVMILGIFTLFAPVHSYAAASYPDVDQMRKELKASFASQNENYDNGAYYKETVLYLNYENGSKAVILFNTMQSPQLDKQYGTLRFVSATGGNNFQGGAVYKRINANGELIRDELIFPDSRSAINFNDTNLSFTLKVPPKPFPGELAVKEVPGILAGQAGTIVLVGCLILGTLLVVGLVKRLISLFIR